MSGHGGPEVPISLQWARSMSDYPFRYGFCYATIKYLLDRLERGDIPTQDELADMRERLRRVDIGGAMGYDGLQDEKKNNVTTENKA